MKLIDFNKAKFILSAAKPAQFLEDIGAEVAFVGRSNSGKSSALNALTRRKNLAKTSKTPGRTQLINFFELDEMHRIVDLPGYGYAKVPRGQKNSWQILIDQYLRSRQSLKVIVLLMDIRHPMRDFDLRVFEWAGQVNIPIHILLTKADKFSRGAGINEFQKVKKALKQCTGQISIQLFSAVKPIGREELEEVLSEYLEITTELV